MTAWQEECARTKREAWHVWWAAFATMVFVLLVSWAFVQPAEARESVPSPVELAESECRVTLYDGLAGTAEASACRETLYLPTSAAFKCQLYKDAGYPSRVMRKACLLFDLGYIESISEEGLKIN